MEAFPAPAPAAALAAAPAQPGPSFLGKMSAGVARHSGLALAAIVVLVVTVAYLYARLQGWFGGKGEKMAPAPKKKKSRTVRASAADGSSGATLATDSEAQIDALIEAVSA